MDGPQRTRPCCRSDATRGPASDEPRRRVA
jgi:hypothetical protein